MILINTVVNKSPASTKRFFFFVRRRRFDEVSTSLSISTSLVQIQIKSCLRVLPHVEKYLRLGETA